MKKTFFFLITATFLSLFKINAQLDNNALLGIPTVSTTAQMNAIPTPITIGNMVYNIETQSLFVYNGGSWISTSNTNWETTGNAGLTTNNFLGTTDNVKMEIRSDNLPILQFGRRGSIAGLTQTFPDYDDATQPLAYLNGDGNTAALQFAASGANFYKPMFFTTTNGSFRLKGSAAGTDFFELGSAGINNNGRVEFTIADDGIEPFVFKRYYYNPRIYREFFRVQGHTNGRNAKTRFGININQQEIPIAGDLDRNYNDAGQGFQIANSTLQIRGSVSKSILTTTANLTLTEDHHTVILGGNHNITLPNANSCEGRIYIIKNTNNFATNISAYINTSNIAGITTINNNSILWLQSDGSNWQQINTTDTVNTVQLTDNGDGTYTFSNGVDPDVTFTAATVITSAYIPALELTNMSYDNATGTLAHGGIPTSAYGYAYSNASQAIIAGNETGSIEFQLVNINNQRMAIGLDSNTTNPTNWNSIDFSFYIDGANSLLVVNGTNVSGWLTPALSNGDILRIEKNSNNIRFYRNGVSFYTVNTTVTNDLYFNARFNNYFATQITELKIIK